MKYVKRVSMLVSVLTVVLASGAGAQAAPDVKNDGGALNIAAGQVRLQGKLVGGGPAEVTVYWGDSDGGTSEANWAHKAALPEMKNGTSFSVDANGLTFGVTYYYRCYASKAGGGAWAPSSVSFTTRRPAVAMASGKGSALPVRSGLVCWYDAAVGVKADGNAVVQTWEDLSGNGHLARLSQGSPVLAANQINSRPAVKFRIASGPCAMNIDVPFFTGQQYVVVRSPNEKWNGDGCFLGRRIKRASSYRLGGKSSAFWGDQYPEAVSRNGKPMRRPFDMAPITEFMILRIDVNDGDMSRNSYQIGMADTASCDYDIAEIIAYQTELSPSDEQLVGGYLAAKYGIATTYPDCAGMASAAAITTGAATNVNATSAIVNATIACPGAAYDVTVYWGTTNGGTDANMWENSAPVGRSANVTSGKLSHTIAGLAPGGKYYYTFRGTNAADSIWAEKVLTYRPAPIATPVPAELPVTRGLACRFDASVGVVADAGGIVQTWSDSSGNGHHAAKGGGAVVLAADQANGRPAVQFRKSWLAVAGSIAAREHYIVLRSPTAQWSGASGLLGRLKGRGSSYNTWANEAGFWRDHAPDAVTRNGAVLPGPAFDCSPLTKYMILKIIVDGDNTSAAHAIGNNDGLASAAFDVAEIIGYESLLSPAEEELVGGYLAAKYGIDTAYPPYGSKTVAAVPAGQLAPVKYKAWKHSGSLYLLTTPDGATMPAEASVENFPVLVRLSNDWFDFSKARAGGEDIRFATAEGVPLAYQIDTWDSASGVALLWVRVPAIKGNARHEFKMYWGSADAKSESSCPAVFNRSNGYLSVWHMNEPARDEVGTVESVDTGTTAVEGPIGKGRHFVAGKKINCGDRITKYPFASSPHSCEAWVRADKFNASIVNWGKGSAVDLRLLSTPPVMAIGDGRIAGTSVLQKGQWIHVAYTYDGQVGQIYVNGKADVPGGKSLAMEVLTPVRMQIGGSFNGDLDEVRVSRTARSADWVSLQYENQKPMQTLVGPLVQQGSAFSVSHKKIALLEGGSVVVTAAAGGAQKLYWIVKNGAAETVAAVDRFNFKVEAGRVAGDQSYTLQCKAVFSDGVKTLDIPVSIREDIPDPVFTLKAPAKWDGRGMIEIVPQIANAKAMEAKGAGALKYEWTVGPIVETRDVAPGKLILKRARNNGQMVVTAAVSNGGAPVKQSVQIEVKQPARDAWVHRAADSNEQPADNQFYARDDKNEGTLHYNGRLADASGEVFLKLYADNKLIKTETRKPGEGGSYSFAVKLKPGLIKYKVELGTRSGGAENVLRTASNLACGDAYIIEGQSNALATSWGNEKCDDTNEWIRSYGSVEGGHSGWGLAVRRGGAREIGYWGMDLAKRLVETYKMPICIINGAVGGTRVDQHQRNMQNPADKDTIYGRLLNRVRHAGLTDGIRGVLWHQGEADQGTDGPDGGYGWETYERYFLDMTAAWKQDYPNIQHYYTYQIWPNSCSQGGNKHSDKFRDVQRLLPRLYSNMSIMSTLGIKPEGPCHYPPAGYAEMARLMVALVERDNYGKVSDKPVTAPDLQRVYYTSERRDAISLEFDQPMAWSSAIASQLYLDGKEGRVASGSAAGNVVTLKLAQPETAKGITYIVDRKWDSKNLLYGVNGIAALTFYEAAIESRK